MARSVRLLINKNPARSFCCPVCQSRGMSFERFPRPCQAIDQIDRPSTICADSSLRCAGTRRGTPRPYAPPCPLGGPYSGDTRACRPAEYEKERPETNVLGGYLRKSEREDAVASIQPYDHDCGVLDIRYENYNVIQATTRP